MMLVCSDNPRETKNDQSHFCFVLSLISPLSPFAFCCPRHVHFSFVIQISWRSSATESCIVLLAVKRISLQQGRPPAHVYSLPTFLLLLMFNHPTTSTKHSNHLQFMTSEFLINTISSSHHLCPSTLPSLLHQLDRNCHY